MAKAISQILTFAQIVALNLSEIAAGLGHAVTLNERQTKARDKFKSEVPLLGKYYAGAENHYTALLNGDKIPKNVSKTDWIEKHAGGKVPGGVYQAANVFTALTLTTDASGTPLLAEENYDECKAEWLRDASAIINHCKEQAAEMAKDGKVVDWRFMDDILDTVKAMSKFGDTGKKLKAIRKRQKGEKETDGDAEPLTLVAAVAFIRTLFADAPNVTRDQQKDMCIALYELNDAWAACGLDGDTLEEFDKEIQAARAAGVAPHIEIVSEAAEVAEPVEA